ncbi:hypothetical protein [Burkholderia ambifaria]|uniref:hypothetical protein n=1 Tax=Burkholderia ambifaria TaxID=152480 RepID=UPI001589286F|nr:hypothetical protein [Burkholderia ambifaria]
MNHDEKHHADSANGTEERIEIPVDNLFEEQSTVDVVVNDLPIEHLPYGQMPWPRFEALCTHILNDDPELRISQAWLYGREGQNQHGIDILAIRTDSARHLVAQSKRVKQVYPSDVTTWVDRFLRDERVITTSKFILFLACRLGEDTNAMLRWAEGVERLREVDIEAEVWDSDQLDQLLRDRPAIVNRFFGPERTRRFCTPAFPSRLYPSQFKSEYVWGLRNQRAIENISLRLDLILPDEESPNLSALFSFARHDLSGITFAVDARTLIAWARWVTLLDPAKHQRPYVWPNGTPDRYTLLAGSVRVTLTGQEVQHLDWVLLQAWRHFLPAAKALDHSWRFSRFVRLRSETKAFVIAHVSRHHWRIMLEFANAHDYEAGSTERHVFDYSQGVLKVFNRSTMLGGKQDPHHVIISAFAEGGMTLPWEGTDVRLVWEPGKSLAGSMTPIGPDDAWDAERTHDWLLDTFRSWVENEINRKKPKDRNWSFSRKQSAAEPFKLSIRSAATYERRDLQSARSASELCELCTFFQGHYHLNLSDLPVAPEMTKNIIRLVHHFRRFIDENNRSYIASNLAINGTNLQEELVALLSNTSVPFHLATRLECALRALVFLLRKTDSLPQSDIELALDLLKPAAQRVREDLLCESLAKAGRNR